MKALCPIHQEDTPSFIYNPKMLNFHCFGCGCNVDIIDAYMMAGDTYLGAVEKLFQETGIAYSFGERGVKTQRSYRYPTEIPVGDRSAVNKYFATRKISEQTLDHCDVRQDEHGNAVFNYYDTNDVLTMVKYRPSRKIDKSKGEIKSWCQKGADTKPLLFNMNRVNTNQPLLITEGECFPGHAEILTPDGWVQFDHYKTQKVLQVNRDPHSGELTGEFVTPKGFVVAKRDGFLSSIRGKRYTSVTTKGHHIVGMDSLGNFKRIDAETFPSGVLHSIPISVRLDGKGLLLSKDQIAFIIAVAENCVARIIRWEDGSSLCKFVANRRKKQWRMRRLLRRLKIPYRDFDGVLKFYLPIWATEILKRVKILDEEDGGSLYAYRLPYSLVEKSSHLDKLRILDAVLRWGNGCITTYENAKVIQTIAHTCGYSCEIKYRLGSIEEPYHVYVSNQHNAFASDLTYKEVPYHGMVYCVTVDSGMILVRQGGRITVSGNCDTMAAIEAGYTNAVSVPLGSQNHHWIEENMEWLDQFSEIIICADNDQPGYRMVKDVCPRLGAWRTKVVEIPDTDPDTGKRIKDLNELLYYRGKQEVLDAILNAKESQINSVEDLSDVDDVNISDIDGIYFGMESLDRELFKLFFGTLTLVTGRPGCVSGDTEFFNGERWKRIDQYEPGDKVLQYNADGTAELVTPLQYHKYPCEWFWKIQTRNRAVDMVFSNDHNMVYSTGKSLQRCTAAELVQRHNASKDGFSGKFITAFEFSGNGIDLTDEQIRIMCAVICDGTFFNVKDTTHERAKRVRINIKKERKKHRLRRLLRDAGIEWTEHSWNRRDPGYTNFIFRAPMRTKVFDSYWYQCTNHQLRVITDEVIFWDGSIDRNGHKSFSTTVKQTADFIQFAFSSCGHRASIRIDDRVGQKHSNGKYAYKSISYEVHVSNGHLNGICSKGYPKLEIPVVPSEDGYKYCFTVPSNMLVLRHNNTINVTSNSGKTSFLYQLVCNTLEQNRPAWIYSRELPDFMSKSWLNYLLAGPRNLEQYVGRSGSIYYRVRAPAKKAINECYRGQWFVYKDAWSNDVDAIQESMEASARKHGTKLFLLDNLMTINLHASDENKYDKQTEFINWLIQFASKFSVCVILVAHPRKIQSGISAASAVDLYDIGGSSNLVNLAHRTLSLRRVTTAEKEQGTSKFAQYSCVVSVTKDRMRGRAGFELGMYYDDACRRFYTNYEEYDRKYRWDTSSYHDRIPCPPLDAEEEVFGEIKREEVV